MGAPPRLCFWGAGGLDGKLFFQRKSIEFIRLLYPPGQQTFTAASNTAPSYVSIRKITPIVVGSVVTYLCCCIFVGPKGTRKGIFKSESVVRESHPIVAGGMISMEGRDIHHLHTRAMCLPAPLTEPRGWPKFKGRAEIRRKKLIFSRTGKRSVSLWTRQAERTQVLLDLMDQNPGPTFPPYLNPPFLNNINEP